MKNRIIFMIVIIMLIPAIASGVMAQSEYVNKDETIYVMLNENGSVNYIKAVNRHIDAGGPEIVDYGEFKDIKALNSHMVPVVLKDVIKWAVGEDFSGDFYYEATLEKELPVNFSIRYFLEGEEISFEKLPGSSGKLEIRIGVKQNKLCDEEHSSKYMTQIQVPVDLNRARTIKAEGAASIITGTSANLSYTVLPGQDSSFAIYLDAVDFEMGSIQITLLDYPLEAPSGFDSMIEGLGEMNGSMAEMAQGTKALENGMNSLSDGVEELKTGIYRLNSGANEIDKGMNDYSKGLQQYKTGFDSLAEGIDKSNTGLQQLNKNTASLEAGYRELYYGLKQLGTGNEQMLQAAGVLLESSDPGMKALGQGIIRENEAIKDLLNGFEKANAGLNEYSKGMDGITAGFQELKDRASLLPDGMAQLQQGYDGLYAGSKGIFSGIKESGNGASALHENVKAIPGEIQKLSEGQQKFADGILQMKAGLEEELKTDDPGAAISFADSRLKINSVQFIMKTPVIKKPGEFMQINEENDEKTWIQRIWMKIKNIFSNDVQS